MNLRMPSIFFVGLFFTVSAQASDAVDLDPVRLQLKWLHQFQFAGYYAAIEKGFYEEEGLAVELLEPGVGENVFDVVLAGNAEFGVSNSEIIRRVAEGDALVQLAVIYQHSALVWLAVRGEGMENLHDLAGKTLMMEPNSADLLAMFLAEGIDLDRLRFIPHDFSIDSLVDGEVQAISAYISDEPFELRMRGLTPVILSPRASGIDFYGDGIFTTRDQVEQHPERVEAFRKASLKGWKYALAHPDEIIELILSRYSQRKTPEQLEYEAHKTMRLVRPELVPVGYMNAGRWEYISQIFEEVGLIDEAVEPSDFLYRKDAHFPWWELFYPLVGLVIFGIIAWSIVWYLYRTNIRLKAAVRQKLEAEEDLRSSELFYRSFFERSPLAFTCWDSEHRVRHWNAAAERVFGWMASEVVGRPFTDFMIPEEERGHIEEVVSTLVRDRMSQPANWNVKKDGTRIWCQWYNVARLDKNGKILECQSIALDLTREHEREENLVLQKEIAEIANENKGRFLASVSHEIRNPLSAIISFASFIREDADTSEKREMADTIISGGESLIRILNDLIDHEKLEAGVVDLVPSEVRIADLVRRATDLYRHMAKEKGLDLEFKTDAPDMEASIDSLRVEQVVNNLLSNAIKFTESGSIQVFVGLGKGEAPGFEIRVEDTGIGMTEKDSERIFELYDRGGNGRNRTYGGTGVGLSVCRKLVALMGGTISVRSEKGKGSVFTVRFPMKMEEEPPR